MPNRLTQLEILAADNPDILTTTKTSLDHGKSSASIASLLMQKYPSISVTKSTVEKYRQKRWAPTRAKLATEKQATAEAGSVISPNALDKMADAILFETMHTLSPATLLGIKRLKLQHDRLKLQKGALRKMTKEETREDKLKKWDSLTEDEKNEKRRKVGNTMRAIFGLCPIEEEDALHEQYPNGIPPGVHATGGRLSSTKLPRPPRN